ncbi:hypothetical protein FA048_04970 [Pedobacter polaris]|uniref:Carboxypeptidase-like regulatory domain-containing protein n=1 Tax=Pedobacter polaris TaxID=2571273 RepID=A0A4V5P0A4_9SPHI|nr:carboxypeptidase-like regulatory domain-containing protein [Pedobacter polaris]TKC12972.1 hypothetical protein FA048_04970 [Pedobacter polaris]
MKRTVSYNEWLDIDVLEDYLDGKLDAKAMHQVEKLSLEDPFVAQALEGLSKSPRRNQSLSLLQKQLQERITLKPVEKKIWAITSQRLSIAAAAAVLFIAVSILFWMKGNKRQEMLASNEPKKVDVKIAPQVATNKQEAQPIIEDKVSVDKPLVPKTTIKDGVDKVKVIKEAPIVVTNEKAVVISPPATAVVTREKVVAEEMQNVALLKGKQQSESKAAVMALPSKAEGITPSYFTGKVISKENGLPIPGAIVRVSGVDRGTATDRNGEFKIASDSTQNQKLTIGYIGYATAEVGAKSNQPINILLENDNKSLKEVSINPASKVGATPLGGWDNYQTYLKANNKLAKNTVDKQEVELDFQVRKDGSVTAIKIIKSAGKENDKEAIRLLKDGPKWIFISNEKNLGQLKIKF